MRAQSRPVPRGGRYSGSRCASSARSPSIQFYELNLLRTACLDSRTIANLDPAAHAYTSVLERLGINSGAREDALLSFRYGDRKRLRPSTAKIRIYSAAAFADRQHFAFDDRETTPSGHQTRQVAGWHYGILRVAPQANLGDSGGTLLGEQLCGARGIADLRPHPSMAPGQHGVGDRAGRSSVRDDKRGQWHGHTGRARWLHCGVRRFRRRAWLRARLRPVRPGMPHQRGPQARQGGFRVRRRARSFGHR